MSTTFFLLLFCYRVNTSFFTRNSKGPKMITACFGSWNL
jgi:hypothetical protein